MRKAHEYLPGLGIAHSDECLVFLGKGFVIGLVALDYLPHPFVHYKDVIILI